MADADTNLAVPTLSPADARMIDLLLATATDGGPAGSDFTDSGGRAAGSNAMSPNTAPNFAAASHFAPVADGPGGAGARLDAADRLLRLLDHLPAADPPAGLAAATLRRVEQAVPTDQGSARVAAPTAPVGRGAAGSVAQSPEPPTGA